MSSLPYQIALEDSLVMSNPMGVLEISASQMTEQRYPSTSVSTSQIQFQNIKLSGTSSLFDSQAFLEYTIKFQADLKQGQLLPGLLFTQASNVASTTISIDPCVEPVLDVNGNSYSTNIPNIVFRQLPLSRVCQNLQISLNNTNSQGYNLNQELALHDVLSEEDKDKLSGFCPCDNPKSVILPNFYNIAGAVAATTPLVLTVDPNYKGGWKQPNNPYWNGGRNHITPIAVSANTAGVYSVEYQIREPLLVDPFTCGRSGPALANVESLTITYSLDVSQNLQGMFMCSKNFYDASGPTVTGLAVQNILDANLIMRTYSVDPSVISIPQIMYYDYSSYQFNPTACTTPAQGSSANKTTNNIGLSTVPKLYVAKIQNIPAGLTSLSQQIGGTVEQITIQYGSMGRYVFTQQQLYEAFIRNTKVVKNFNDWVNDCVIVINPSLDLQNTAQSFTGMANSGSVNWSVQYTFNCDNLYLGGQTPQGDLFINEMYIFAGSLAIGQGQAVYNTTTISAGQLVSLLEKPMVSSKAIKHAHAVRAGSLFSSLGNVLRGAVSALPGVVGTASSLLNTANTAMSHPLVQSALGALSGAGQGAGLTYSSRRGRR